MQAERLARTEGHIGAVAFSRTGDRGSDEFADAACLGNSAPAGFFILMGSRRHERQQSDQNESDGNEQKHDLLRAANPFQLRIWFAYH
jgi:hypothetical protein